MPPRIRSRGLANLGQALDERKPTPSIKLVIRKDLGTALPAPLVNTLGAGSGSSAPVLPEAVVESLKAQGESSALSGDLTLAAGGELTLTQSSTASHFTFSSPEYTAGDGLTRSDNEFSCDSSVIRNNGNQSVGGVKTFTQFPLTPSTLPAANYETANKLYVDQHSAPVVIHLPGSSLVPTPVTVINPDSGAANRLFCTSAWPAEASFAAVSAAPQLQACFDPPQFGISCVQFTWTSQSDGIGGINSGSALGFSMPLVKACFTDGSSSQRAVVCTRLLVNSPNRFSAIHVVLNDVDDANSFPSNLASADVLGSLASNQWTEVVLDTAGTDITTWGKQLRAGLVATGTESDVNAGPTTLAIDWLRVEFWRS